ncbi:hypothetical protein [Lysobacter sp. Root494]|uniref:hypothetical protein n=1 Tax=Lysobacter sp. Root494 TaxID=1736549 RepID=UPI000700B21D|nr:hypothetical protein [Lysobacter sp. Root494]KQY51770.1 hypothetical protein ASD14_03525 [Lysobacter sp. Root494]
MNAQTATHAPPEIPAAAKPAAKRATADATHARNGWGALLAGLQRGFHPQLLLAWVIMLWLPAAIAALPAALWLYLEFGHSPMAAAIAADTDATFIASALEGMQGEAVLLGACAVFALLVAVLLSPWLSGMIVAQIRTVYRLRVGGVVRAGLGEYSRMLRMLVLSAVLLAVAAAIGIAAMVGIEWLVTRFAPSPEDLAPSRMGWLLPIALVLFVHMTVEAGRGWLGADLALNSVTQAWKRGIALLWKRPGATLTVYLGTSLVGVGLAIAFLRLRAFVDASGWTGWLLAFACTQLVVASMAWGRSARLHGLADLATAQLVAPPEDEADASSEAPRTDTDTD